MGTYIIDNHFPKVGGIILQSGMILCSGDNIGPCEITFGKLYIYPVSGDAMLVNIGEECEVVPEPINIHELVKRQNAIVGRHSSWQEQIGEENTRQFDPSNESW